MSKRKPRQALYKSTISIHLKITVFNALRPRDNICLKIAGAMPRLLEKSISFLRQNKLFYISRSEGIFIAFHYIAKRISFIVKSYLWEVTVHVLRVNKENARN